MEDSWLPQALGCFPSWSPAGARWSRGGLVVPCSLQHGTVGTIVQPFQSSHLAGPSDLQSEPAGIEEHIVDAPLPRSQSATDHPLRNLRRQEPLLRSHHETLALPGFRQRHRERS